MASTVIQISSSSHQFTASPDSAPFNPGDAVSFVAAPDVADAVICFSESALEVLATAPDGTAISGPVPLPAGMTLEFTVAGAAVSGCGAMIVTSAGAGTPDCGDSPAGVLTVMTPESRPGPPDNWQ